MHGPQRGRRRHSQCNLLIQVDLKARSIRQDSAHPLNPEYMLLPSGRRLCVPRTTKNKYKYSFVPASIRAVNAASNR